MVTEEKNLAELRYIMCVSALLQRTKMRTITVLLCTIITFTSSVSAFQPKWLNTHSIEKEQDTYIVKGPDPFMVSETIEKTIPQQNAYLQIKTKASMPAQMHLYWWKTGQTLNLSRFASFVIPASDDFKTTIVDLNKTGLFKGLNTFRIGVASPQGVKFEILDIEFITSDQVPNDELIKQCDFNCYTSKLHYAHNQTVIDYQVSMLARNYPERRSSKILQASIVNSAGKTVATQYQQYGIADILQRKVLYGTFNFDKPLPPGKYTLKAISTDQMTSEMLSSKHIFSIQTKDAPFVYETPFKFVKDFSIIRDSNGLWHIFSITGDFIDGHAWVTAGHERTFSHGTSKDLRNWTYHKPVLTISDKTFPDGNGKFKDRNIWAPHVIYHDGLYYMFYTSVNSYVCQSVSLATSKDLFNWTEHDNNPVFTLENLEWALWGRTQWSDCRDPGILKDGNTFYMYVTAHSPTEDPRGIVAVTESKDLINWTTPQIAVRHLAAMESPQLWKQNGKFYMTTSAHGQGTWVSDRPDKGWEKTDFPRPPINEFEKDVATSSSYAEEVIRLEDGRLIIASLTWRHWGNTIYISEIQNNKEGEPISYKSPFSLH